MLIGGSGVLVGGGSMLVRTGCVFLRRADAACRLVVNLLHLVAGVLDLLNVLGSLLAHLIHLCLDGGGRILHVLLRGTTTEQQAARQNARGC
jgi:hypothetical protein